MVKLKHKGCTLVRAVFILLLIFTACSSPEPPSGNVKPKVASRPKAVTPKTVPSPWVVKNYVDAGGTASARKYARFDTDGTFSDSTSTNGYMHSVILLNKENAGILLSLNNKTTPAKKFSGQVTIKLKNSAGRELEMISSRGWNKSGGILIEQKNNDYSQFRIFMLQSEGIVNVDIRDGSSSAYKFNMVATGFGESLSQL